MAEQSMPLALRSASREHSANTRHYDCGRGAHLTTFTA
jgi:hypothetical protein